MRLVMPSRQRSRYESITTTDRSSRAKQLEESVIKSEASVYENVDFRYLEFQGTLLNTSRYPYLDI